MGSTSRPSDLAPPATASAAAPAVGRGAWLALTAALLGWMFDGFEMGLFSLVGGPAIRDLLGIGPSPTADQNAQVGLLFGVIVAMFLVGAATGGVLFGWLGDRIGRVRAMTLSVFTYAVFTGLCGLAGIEWTLPGLRLLNWIEPAWQVAVLRFIAALGMGGEWSLGVALVMEVWPDRSRALMAGLIGGAANVGYLMVGVIGLGLVTVLAQLGEWLSAAGLPQEWSNRMLANQGWRILMLIGALPALLTFFIRLFVPESNRWLEQKAKGATSSWAMRDLLGVLVGGTGPALIIYLWASPKLELWAWLAGWIPGASPDPNVWVRIAGSVLGFAIALIGYTYPVVGYLRRDAARSAATAMPQGRTIGLMLLGAALSGVALLGTWASAQWAAYWADQLKGLNPETAAAHAKEWTQMWSAGGAILGTMLAALAGDWLGRRVTYSLLCITSLGSVALLYLGNTTYGNGYLAAAFLVGVCTASFYGWLPLYLPELFRTSVRATGQGFSFNFGRILAAIGALQAGNLMNTVFKEDVTFLGGTFKGCPVACTLMSLIYLVGLGLIWLAPETKGRPLPE